MSEILSELEQAFSNLIPIEQTNVGYRLYYDTDGAVTYITSNVDLPGTYLSISKSQYDTIVASAVKVVNKEIVHLNTMQLHAQLKKSDSGVKVVVNHPGLIIMTGDEIGNSEVEYYSVDVL